MPRSIEKLLNHVEPFIESFQEIKCLLKVSRHYLEHKADKIKFEPYQSKGNRKDIVIAIHGYAHKPQAFKQLGHYLAENGYTVYAIAYPSNNSLEHVFERHVKPKILEIAKKENAKGLCLVGHSLGGIFALMVLDYFNNNVNNNGAGTKVRIRKCITLGTPIKGTYVAYVIAPFSSLASQAVPRSMEKSPIPSIAQREEVYAIYSPIDEAVIPRSSAAAAAHSYKFLAGHHRLLEKPQVLEKIVEILDCGCLGCEKHKRISEL
jgi:esterase/lipase